MVKAWNMVQIASSNLQRKSRKFGDINTAARSFAEKVNDELEEFTNEM